MELGILPNAQTSGWVVEELRVPLLVGATLSFVVLWFLFRGKQSRRLCGLDQLGHSEEDDPEGARTLEAHSEQQVMNLTCVPFNTPTGRVSSAAAIDEAQGVLYTFGGEDREGVFLGDLNAFHLSSSEWRLDLKCCGDVPRPRVKHSVCSFGEHLILYGGECDLAGEFSELDAALYVCHTSSVEWVKFDLSKHQVRINAAPAGCKRSPTPSTLWTLDGIVEEPIFGLVRRSGHGRVPK